MLGCLIFIQTTTAVPTSAYSAMSMPSSARTRSTTPGLESEAGDASSEDVDASAAALEQQEGHTVYLILIIFYRSVEFRKVLFGSKPYVNCFGRI